MPFGLDDHFYRFVLPLVVIESVLFTYAFTSDPRTCQTVLGLVGVWWCLAALWVEIKIEQTYPGFDHKNPVDPKMKAYKPFCDFAPWAACSKVLMSPPGRFLLYFGIAKQRGGSGLIDRVREFINVPNPTLGLLFFGCHLFYPALLLFPIPFLPQLFFIACCFVGCMTVWLAYHLISMGDFCIVCVSMYVANFALIPMMYSICQRSDIATRGALSFGDVPLALFAPFLLLDTLMGIGVGWLYIAGLGKPAPLTGRASEGLLAST